MMVRPEVRGSGQGAPGAGRSRAKRTFAFRRRMAPPTSATPPIIMAQLAGENFRDESLDPAAAAGALGCSVRYVHKVCHAHGTTFRRMLTETRLAAAAHALSSAADGKRISMVGYDSGFADFSHFCRLFKREFGVSPRVFRDGRL